MPSTTIYSDGNGNIVVDGTTYSAADWLAMGGAAGLGLGGTGDATASPGGDNSAKAYITDFLNQFGLGSLADKAWSYYLTHGANEGATIDFIEQSDEFAARFPAMKTLQQEGRAISPADYVNYEQTVYGLAHQYGLTPGLVNEDTITGYLEKNWNAATVAQQFQQATEVVNQLDKNSQEYLKLRELGISDGDLAAYWINPDANAALLERKLAAAQVGGAAADAGITLGTGVAEDLADRGIGASEARQGYAQIAGAQQLFSPLPGATGQTFDQQQQAGAVFGTDANAARQLQKTAAQRVAAFSGSTQFASTNAGVTGAGPARGV